MGGSSSQENEKVEKAYLMNGKSQVSFMIRILPILLLLSCAPKWSWSEVQIVKICKDWDNVYIYVTENTDSVKIDFVTLEPIGEYTFYTTKAFPVSPMDHFPVIEIVIYYGMISRKNVKMDVRAWNKYSFAIRRFYL